jgi:hypothetical protein
MTTATSSKRYATVIFGDPTPGDISLNETGPDCSASDIMGFADNDASQAAFPAGAAPLRVDTCNTSRGQAKYLKDRIGGLKLVGSVGSKGGLPTT